MQFTEQNVTAAQTLSAPEIMKFRNASEITCKHK